MFGNAMEILIDALSYPDVGSAYECFIDDTAPTTVVVESHRYPGARIFTNFKDMNGACEIVLEGANINDDMFSRACYQFLGEERFVIDIDEYDHIVHWDETEMGLPEDLAGEIANFILYGIDEN